MTYIEGTTYKLQSDYYESILLHCTFVEDNTIWLVHKTPSLNSNVNDLVYYKLNRKTNKLYKLNLAFSSWDSVENTLSECMAEDVWSKRIGNNYYNGIGQQND